MTALRWLSREILRDALLRVIDVWWVYALLGAIDLWWLDGWHVGVTALVAFCGIAWFALYRKQVASREQSIRIASLATVTDLPATRASASGLDGTRRPARTRDAREEVAEAVIEALDVRQHAHARIVRTTGEGVHAVP